MSSLETPPTPTPTPGDAERAGRTCPRCGAGLTDEQDWCLSCGTAVTTRVERPPNWRLPLAVVATVLVLAVAALAVAFVELSDDEPLTAQAPEPTATATAPPAPTPAATTPTPAPDGAAGTTRPPEADLGDTTEPEPGAATDAGDGTGGAADPGAATGADPGAGAGTDGELGGGDASPSGGEFAAWPEGEEAWTVILFSGETREEAERRAREFQDAGRSVGILRSDDYSTLREGYWVVFSGQYERQSDAQAAAESVTGADGPYARFVDPR